MKSHIGGEAVRTVQMTLDADLVSAVDKAARRLGTTRSAFARMHSVPPCVGSMKDRSS